MEERYMQHDPLLADELSRLLARSHVSRAKLIQGSGRAVSAAALSRWLSGQITSINNPDAVIALADGLGLNRVAADRLARASGFDSIDELVARADSLDARRRVARWERVYTNNLPSPVTRFIGRTQHLREITELLGVWDDRLVTLHGPAGSGKTRLAIEAAMRLRDAFPDGLFLVRLAEVSTSHDVAPSILRVLGVTQQGNLEPTGQLTGYLRERRLLLVLDNFEHLLEARLLVSDLLRTAEGLRVLVTSRVPLELSGEVRWPVEPLQLPSDLSSPAAARSEAVALFADRARAAWPAFRPTAAMLPDIARLCRNLDGLPLAIELVAAHIDADGPAGLVQRYSGPPALDVVGPVDLERRQTTLRSAIEWSARLVAPADAQLLARLSVFAGGWTTADASAVCGDPEFDVPAGLARLERAALLARTADIPDARWSMLETIRTYAREQLDATGETQQFCRRLAEHLLSIAAAAGDYYPQSRQGLWMDRLDHERANIDAALTWATTHDPLLALRLATALWPFWHEYEHIPDGIRWLPSALSTVPDAPPELRANALTGLAFLWQSVGDYPEAIRCSEEAVRLWRELGSNHGLGLALMYGALPRLYSGDVATLDDMLTAALAALHANGDPRGIAWGLNYTAVALMFAGRVSDAEARFAQADEIWQALGDEVGMVRTILDRGIAAVLAGRYQRAIRLLSQIVDRKPQAHMAGVTPIIHFMLGVALFRSDRLEESATQIGQAIRVHWEVGDLATLALDILAYAAIAIRRALQEPVGSATRLQLAERAATLAGAGAALQERIQSSLPVVRAIYDEELAKVRQELSPQAFVSAFKLGANLGEAQAYRLAISVE